MKIDISISRETTISTGPFGNVKPNASITLRDLEKKEIYDEFLKASNALDAIIAIETVKMLSEDTAMRKIGATNYCEQLEENIEDIKEDLRAYAENRAMEEVKNETEKFSST